jgi:glycosyltransferase involved in cell wall biosynthesis
MAGTQASVFIDGFVYTYQRHGGINRIFEEVAPRLAGLGIPVSIQVPRGTVLPFTPHKKYEFPKWLPVRKCWQAVSHVNFFRSRAAVYMASYYGSPPARRGFALTTLYDMIPELMGFDRGEQAEYWRRFLEQKKRCLLASDHLIAISEHTRKDFLALYPQVSPERVSVLHLAVGPEFSPGEVGGRGEPYILFVGNRGGYKNFAQLLKTYAESERLRAAYRLTVLTPPAWTDEEMSLMAPFAARVDRLPSATPEELVALYRGAAVFVYPSLYEGFGLPILEGMACGVPVVTSCRASMPEVGGDAAVYFDPDRPGDLRRVLEDVCFDDGLRGRLRQLGPARAARFTWDAFASGVADLVVRAKT